jgi:hypothetical protein
MLRTAVEMGRSEHTFSSQGLQRGSRIEQAAKQWVMGERAGLVGDGGGKHSDTDNLGSRQFITTHTSRRTFGHHDECAYLVSLSTINLSTNEGR